MCLLELSKVVKAVDCTGHVSSNPLSRPDWEKDQSTPPSTKTPVKHVYWNSLYFRMALSSVSYLLKIRSDENVTCIKEQANGTVCALVVLTILVYFANACKSVGTLPVLVQT